MTPRRFGEDRVLVLAYRLPANPSRYRVSVWRRLRRAGARAVHRALFTLRDTPLNRLRALDIAHDVENWGGEAWMFVGEPLTGRRWTEAERGRPAGPKRRPFDRVGRKGRGADKHDAEAG